MDLDSNGVQWLDEEGASLIGTLRKAWKDDVPFRVVDLTSILIMRADTRDASPEELEKKPAGAMDSAGLAVAHLLPTVLRSVVPYHTGLNVQYILSS